MTAETDQVGLLVQQAMAEFGCAPDSRVTFVKHRENHVFRVTDDHGEWALKLHRAGYRSDREIESEAAACDLIGSAGVRVPHPLRTRSGSYVAHVGSGEGTLQATMQVWVPDARPIGDSAAVLAGGPRPADETLFDLGRTMALMHRCAEQGQTPPGYERPAWDVEGLVGADPLWGRASELPALDARTRSLVLELEQRLRLELGALGRSARTYGPIHGDLTMENVLLDDDGLVVIDFDDMGDGWYVFDIATACFFFIGHPEGKLMIDRTMEGYALERALTPEDARAWHPLLLARALTYLGWSVARPTEDATAFHIAEVLPRVVAAGRRYLDTGHTGWPDLPVG